MKKITLHSDTLSLLLQQAFDDGYKAGFTKSSILDYQEETIKECAERTINGRYILCCPFHKEKTPSLSYECESKKYTCFGCGKEGDLKELWRELIINSEKITSTSNNASPQE